MKTRKTLPDGYKIKRLCDCFSVYDYTSHPSGKIGRWMPETRAFSRDDAIRKLFKNHPELRVVKG
jgi:hypothetical protein